MVSPMNTFAVDLDAAATAAKRWSTRRTHHRKVELAKSNSSYSNVESPERVLLRAQRLESKNAVAVKPDLSILVESFNDARSTSKTAPLPTQHADELSLERVINRSRDFQFTAFLEQALYVSHAVCRIATNIGNGCTSYGTGFMVTPGLLLTNHHVLPSIDVAMMSMAEFEYQRDRWGNVAAPQPFPLNPKKFFINDKKLDFAMVAVDFSRRTTKRPLVWCPMIKELGKIITLEHINIIQHPRGEVKQVVIRENRLLDWFDGKDIVLHYEADTEPGSSGSPVFNDQWEVVALHHSGVPRTDSDGRWLKRNGDVWTKGDNVDDVDWIANEGIRTSKIVHAVEQLTLKGAARDLQQEFLAAIGPEPSAEFEKTLQSGGSTQRQDKIDIPPPPPDTTSSSRMQIMSNDQHSSKSSTYQLTIPIRISIQVGEPEPTQINAARFTASSTDQDDGDAGNEQLEKIMPDVNYEDRPGYDPDFLGFGVPFPKLTVSTRSKAYALDGKTGDNKYLLNYYHYSLIFNKTRKLAFVAGVNFDPTARYQHPRDKGGDKWFFDPRVHPSAETQAGEDLYAKNPLDRGHLVRRADAAWGKTAKQAKLANDDTFHFTNCSPQHEITNQGKSSQAPPGLALWGDLENYVASQGKKVQRPLSIFNGPIMRENDRIYRGVKLPKQFWKVIVFQSDAGKPTAAAFKLTQASLIKGLEEAFEFEDYKPVQLSIKQLESETGLDFGKIASWDALDTESAQESFESETGIVILNGLNDIVL